MATSKWIQFLTHREMTFNEDLRLCDWVEDIVVGIRALLQDTRYTLSVPSRQLSTCILNALYRHEQDYKRGCRTTYQCRCIRHHYSLEDYEYYETQIPDEDWDSLREYNFIDWYSDAGPFADRIWMAIPWIVFTHLNLNTSGASEELARQFRTIEDDEYDDEEGH